ncbi:MAG TPA: metalloregulator ArsR/SmtB family transcription factor [Spirochaetota bacterium]|nr:metalloregulator ArsR/SmtB family transcription factor [Spirochaetota bacterium]HNT12856.1 metalloregulator ArsR/SmtB family transcription factor [Spirochaetota bacterium]HNV47089.1 metalloregulator ArsR/SmtB family transcription factor [Spirochaetota bacterium]HOS38913.1 metalloregulator ArsR/SmtB family transcription factor [Spirochaetota bacterium]HPU88231.1 metalloregulator ArsR/SmtB family transcription factor [Spirochaetota bacterium]
MNDATRKQYVARASIIKAMAHPTRLFVIEALEKGERCVNDLTDMIGADMSTVSKHLSILKNAGIIGDKKSGTSVFYHLKTPCILGFFGCIEDVIESNMRQQGEVLKSCKARR